MIDFMNGKNNLNQNTEEEEVVDPRSTPTN